MNREAKNSSGEEEGANELIIHKNKKAKLRLGGRDSTENKKITHLRNVVNHSKRRGEERWD